jgi:hypothetical protein
MPMCAEPTTRICPRLSVLVCVLFCVIALLACELTAQVAPPPTITRIAPTATPTITVVPTRKPVSAPPAWWDGNLVMPKGAEFDGDPKRAVWMTRDLNADGIKDFIVRQASDAGYQPFVITLSSGAIYDVLLVKGQNTYAVNITLGSDATIITVTRVGVMHLKVSGTVNVELDLPLRARLDTTPGSEASFGTSIPNPQCATCVYFVNVHVAPFKGPGIYDSKPGLAIIDIQIIPGGTPEQDDYRWAQMCLFAVDPINGNFTCGGLQNVNDQTKRIDVTGSWVQPEKE